MSALDSIKRGFSDGVRIAKAACDKHNRSIPEWVWDGLRRREEIRIAIIGAKKSGKTVLWTAVENYLRYLKTSSSDKLGEWKVFEVEPQKPFGWSNFDYGHIRAKLAESDGEKKGWPSETDKVWCRALDVDLIKNVDKGKRIRRQVCLRVLDIPGERFSDIGTMYGISFGEWSCNLDKYWLDNPSESSKAHATYKHEVLVELEKLDRDKFNGKEEKECLIERVAQVERACFASYRTFIKELRDSYSQFVTPSTYVMSDPSLPSGAQKVREDELYGDCGFVPLPKESFDMKGRGVQLLMKRFDAAYRKYKENLKIDKVAAWLETANQAYYLIDILAILQNGKSAKEGVESQIRNIGERLFSNYRDPILKKTLKFLFKTQINKFCLIVTQADRTFVERDAVNLKKLGEGLFSNLFDKIDGATTNCIVCSAVRAAVPKEDSVKEKVELDGKFMLDRNQPPDPTNLWHGPYYPPVVPSSWKEAWNAKGQWDGASKGWWLFPVPMGFPKDYEDVPGFYHLDEVVKSMVFSDEGVEL